ncbi:uncharacterized protein LOC116350969, partial [Contarinia nasturtii]|uniref:uncharacterized protein LOC116350969 n=1 Tax=Contarinia nasturtii TaxID=265458 RepID=UPI0012D445AE
VRESYIRRRLLTTDRAIERLWQSEFNLDQLATMATSTIAIPVPELIVPHVCVETNTRDQTSKLIHHIQIDTQKKKSAHENRYLNRNLTIHDIENERGRPLSKYDRNMLIFNWLHSLDESATTENIN